MRLVRQAAMSVLVLCLPLASAMAQEPKGPGSAGGAIGGAMLGGFSGFFVGEAIDVLLSADRETPALRIGGGILGAIGGGYLGATTDGRVGNGFLGAGIGAVAGGVLFQVFKLGRGETPWLEGGLYGAALGALVGFAIPVKDAGSASPSHVFRFKVPL